AFSNVGAGVPPAHPRPAGESPPFSFESMSALALKTDIVARRRRVCFEPHSDMAICSKNHVRYLSIGSTPIAGFQVCVGSGSLNFQQAVLSLIRSDETIVARWASQQRRG